MDNVIHVDFHTGRKRASDAERSAPSVPSLHRSGAHCRDALVALYSRADVAKILAVAPTRLRSWERAGLIRPSADEQGTKRYTFQDLVTVRTVKDLVDRGVPVARIRRALEALCTSFPGIPRSEVRLVSNGATVAVRQGNTTFDPRTGQVLLNLSSGTEVSNGGVVRPLSRPSTAVDARTAYDYFLEGCRLDADETTRSRAEDAYRRAIELDPTLACAYTNLGILRWLDGDLVEAEILFSRAMAIDPSQSEAPYNLGFLYFQTRRFRKAIELLTRAIELDPEFADAHYHLAMALEHAGRDVDALPHWSAYLALDPDGPYASVARARIHDDD